MVKPPLPTKASKSTKTKPTAANAFLSKIKPTSAPKSKPTSVGIGNKVAQNKPNNAAKANGNGKESLAKPNSNGKDGTKPTVPSKVNGNGKGKIVIEKKVNGKSSAEKKANSNGKAAVVSKGKANGKAENKNSNEAKANGNNKHTSLSGKKNVKVAAGQAKLETTTKPVTVKASKTNKLEPTKPTKILKPQPTKVAKIKSVKTPVKAEVKASTKVKTFPPQVSKKAVVKKIAPTQVASTPNPRPTPPRSTKPKVTADSNVKSQHRAFPPFDLTFLSGTTVPEKNAIIGVQQVHNEGSRPLSHLSSLFTSFFCHLGSTISISILMQVLDDTKAGLQNGIWVITSRLPSPPISYETHNHLTI